MGALTSNELVVFFLGLTTLLASAHLLGEVARRWGQPAVIGEMIGGVLLGPTVFGALAPAAQAWLFPHHTPAAIGLDALVALSIALLLLVAGMEVDLSTVWRQGRATIGVALAGLAVPLVAGGLAAWLLPEWWGLPEGMSATRFAIFVGTALAVSALPVIAKILLDLDLFQSDIGMLVLVASTACNLVVGLLFSFVMGGDAGHPIGLTIALTLGFTAFMLTVGRRAAHRALPWVQAHMSWPGGVLGFLIVVALLGGAATELIGIHFIFGAFLAGIALGDSTHLREHTRQIIMRFVDGVFAPIFVAAIGLEVNFVSNFRPDLVLGVLALGTATKVLGCFVAARLGNLGWSESWATGWALNARGELGIVLGLLAWQAGLIDESLFVALVVLAMVSSASAGPMIARSLRRQRTRNLGGLLDGRLCILNLDDEHASGVIAKLSRLVAERTGIAAEEITHAVEARESLMSTALGQGVAVPHARLPVLRSPIVAVGLHRRGIDFNAPDGEPVHLVFLILTPLQDVGAQLQILASIAHLMRDPEVREHAMVARTPIELLAALRVANALQKVEAMPA